MIVLTGASGGLGKHIFKNMSKREEVIGIVNSSKIEQSGMGVVVNIDLENQKQIEQFALYHRKKLTHITLVNAAVFNHDDLLANYESSNLLKTFNVNLFSNIHLVKNLLPLMINQRYGRIIHISSLIGQSGAVGAGIYAASKSALLGYSKSLCLEYGRFGITSNIISLGYFEGGLTNTLDREKVAKKTRLIPTRRLGKYSDIAAAIDFIRECQYFNGEILQLHGGL